MLHFDLVIKTLLLFVHSIVVLGVSNICVYESKGNLIVESPNRNSDSCKAKYIDLILRGGHSYPSYFLNVSIIDKNGTKADVVIANGDLFPILSEEQKLDRPNYNQIIKNSVLEGIPLKLQKAFDEYPQSNDIFFMCTDDEVVKKVALKGSEYFIKYFYSAGVDKPATTHTVDYAAVIKQLITWNIPVRYIEGVFEPLPGKFICP